MSAYKQLIAMYRITTGKEMNVSEAATARFLVICLDRTKIAKIESIRKDIESALGGQGENRKEIA